MTNATLRIVNWTQFRDELQTRRQARAEAKSLRKDLSTFTTAADLADLEALLDQRDPAETLDVRRILNRQRAA